MISTTSRLEEWRLALREADACPEGSDARRLKLEEADQARLRYAIEVGHVAADQAALAAHDAHGAEADRAGGQAQEFSFPSVMWRTTTGG